MVKIPPLRQNSKKKMLIFRIETRFIFKRCIQNFFLIFKGMKLRRIFQFSAVVLRILYETFLALETIDIIWKFVKMSDKKILKQMKKFIAESYNLEAAMESASITQDDVDNFREILLSCEEVPKAIPDKLILLLLIMGGKNFDECVKFARTYCIVVRESPEFFSNRDLESKEVQSCLDNQYYIALPPTPDNCNLLYHKLKNFDPKYHVFEAAEKTFFLTVGKWFSFPLGYEE